MDRMSQRCDGHVPALERLWAEILGGENGDAFAILEGAVEPEPKLLEDYRVALRAGRLHGAAIGSDERSRFIAGEQSRHHTVALLRAKSQARIDGTILLEPEKRLPVEQVVKWLHEFHVGVENRCRRGHERS